MIAGAYRLHTPPSEVGVEPAVLSAVREVKTGSHAAPETMGNAERERERLVSIKQCDALTVGLLRVSAQSRRNRSELSCLLPAVCLQ